MPPQQPNQPLTSVHPDADHSALWKILAVMIGILAILGGIFTYFGLINPAQPAPPAPPIEVPTPVAPPLPFQE